MSIDPNREIAYRYWGDALAAMNNSHHARAKYIDAIVAEPYKRRSWTGLQNWLAHYKLELNVVELNDRAKVTANDANHINLTLDSNLGKGDKDDPKGLAWTTYGLGRASWRSERFKKEFPNEPKYRYTLRGGSRFL